MIVITANIGRGVAQYEAKANIARVRRAFPTAPCVGWQEIDEADLAREHDIIDRLFPRRGEILPGDEHRELERQTRGRGFTTVAGRTAVPISVPAPWRVLRERVELASRGVPGLSPRRVAVSALLEHMGREDLPKLVRSNGHMSLRRTPAGVKASEDAFEVWQAETAMWFDRGFTNIITLDPNWRDMPKLHPKQKIIVNTGIDLIVMVPGSIRVSVRRVSKINLTVDRHEAHAALLALSAA